MTISESHTQRAAGTVDLDEPAAREASACGAKASSLATAVARGLPIAPGFVITTEAHRAYLDSGRVITTEIAGLLRPVWASFTTHHAGGLVVRSSSTIEDTGSSSMAGQFTSLLDVRGWNAFIEAVATVLRSADRPAGGDRPAPMAVLVQRFVPAVRSGVLFGVDPVTGDRRHLVVDAVTGGPDQLVSGQVTAQHYVLSHAGRPISIDSRSPYRRSSPERLLSHHQLVALARLSRRARSAFGRPQDIEWAIDGHGHLVLLQSRPVTAVGAWASGTGPVLGPGPIAETFPDPLAPLEIDLWIEPLRAGVVQALTETRAVSRSHLRRSPVIATVNARVAADLELFGHVRKRRVLDFLDPRPPCRHLSAAWRIGQLRAELPARCRDLVAEVDQGLSSTTVGGSSSEDLLDILASSVQLLVRLHHAEVLAGSILPPATRSAAAKALSVLGQSRSDSSATLVARHPILLSLVPPSIEAPVMLPPLTTDQVLGRSREALPPREQLRLRVRWVQELTCRVATMLGWRLHAAGVLDDPVAVSLLKLDELIRAVRDGTTDVDLHERRAALLADAFAPPLPPEFRLSGSGEVVPASRPGARPGGGVGAGGGRGAGTVVHGSTRRPPAAGDVLVVRDLDPALAPYLPGLAGLVAESGATLSHLAILAREYGVPTVVAVHDARQRFPAGCRLLVDGSTGEVGRLDQENGPSGAAVGTFAATAGPADPAKVKG